MQRFACVCDGVPAPAVAALRDAAATRGLAFEVVDARTFGYEPEQRLQPGDLLYRAATSRAALWTELFLYGPGVATFYAGAATRPYFVPVAQPLHLARAGVPVRETVFCGSANRARLDAWVERLGGFPVVAIAGGRGNNDVLIESRAALYSFADFALSTGIPPAFTAHVAGAVNRRIVVVGSEAVASHVAAGSAPDDGDIPAPVAAAAVAAIAALKLAFGGVDVLHAPDGRSYVREAHFPCDLPETARDDVAGAMLEFLLAKAARETAHVR